MKEQEINLYWEKIINTMNDGLMIVGTDGIILMVNESFENLSGYKPEEVIGMPCTMLSTRLRLLLLNRCALLRTTFPSSGSSLRMDQIFRKRLTG